MQGSHYDLGCACEWLVCVERAVVRVYRVYSVLGRAYGLHFMVRHWLYRLHVISPWGVFKWKQS